MKTQILLANNYIFLVADVDSAAMDDAAKRKTALGTVLSNLAFYGYMPSKEVFNMLNTFSIEGLGEFWNELRPALEEISGANRNMADFVVYKNFPKEVLSKSKGEYWFNQILMYWGAPNELFTEEVEERPEMLEKLKLKVLSLAPEGVFVKIYDAQVKNTARWNDNQRSHMKYLVKELNIQEVNVDDFAFKTNGIVLANEVAELPVVVKMSNATDVLRLAACMSDGDISLRTNVKFKKFKRSERRKLLAILEQAKNLGDDVFMRPDAWKKFLKALRPGDYNFKAVSAAYDKLYRKDYVSYSARIEAGFFGKDAAVLSLLAERPGEFMRRFHKAYNLFGELAVDSFIAVVPKLSTIQILKVNSYLKTINNRKELIYAPGGNWTRAKFVPNEKQKVDAAHLEKMDAAFKAELSRRIGEKLPSGVKMGDGVYDIKIQTNDQELADYGRGTVFDIPQGVNFLRSASFWATGSGYSNTWFDNSWNFFDENWKGAGACCWTSVQEKDGGAVFSGDPTNSKDLEGRACQMIDLYIDKLVVQGVRYAVWSILCYSGIPFAGANDVLATLQWGQDENAGKLYEPSRAQMVFPVLGDSLTKYIAYVDLVERKLVYMDANLFGTIQDARQNAERLSLMMPAYLEYLKALPSVGDLFEHAAEGDTPVLYSDSGIDMEVGTCAFVFKPENEKNSLTKMSLQDILG